MMENAEATVDLVLPCLNEEAAISWIARGLPSSTRVILSDNESDDGSAGIARAVGFEVVSVPRSLAVGAVTTAGIAQTTAEIVCVMDCDGTVDPRDLAALIQPIVAGEADVVVGSRKFMRGSWSAPHRLAIYARAAVLRLARPDWQWDDLGSVRAYRRTGMPDELMSELSRGNAWSLDFMLRAVDIVGHDRVAAVPISYHPRIGKSKITGTFGGLLLTAVDSIRVLARFKRERAATRKVTARLQEFALSATLHV